MSESSGGSGTSGEPVSRDASDPATTPSVKRKPFYHHLYFWVLLAIVAGAVVGVVAPSFAVQLKPLADGFVKLIRMLIAPIIFTTVVVGIASLGNLAEAGRLGIKALTYFITMTLIALAIGLVVINVLEPGVGLNITPDPADAEETLGSLQETPSGIVPFLLHIIPDTFVGAFADGEIIQVLFLAILSGIALTAIGEYGAGIVAAIDAIGKMVFRVVHIVLYAAPIGAFGGMAYTVGRFDVGVLGNLASLMAAFYATCLVFILVVLATVAAVLGRFNLFKFIRLIKDELLIVLGTSSSESVLPRIMAKLENAGAARSVVGLTIPTGYSFNLDGTCIYLTMGAIFIAQATNTQMSIGQQIGLLLLLLLVSKGAAGVTGAGLVTLAAGLQAFGAIPAVGIALIVGIDRFMSEARAITNLIGNAVATMVIARWEPGGRDEERFREVLDDPSLIQDIDVPEEYETPEEYAESHRRPATLPPEQTEEQAPAGR
jgi:aerobic C4-dicarboxylate transport protein